MRKSALSSRWSGIFDVLGFGRKNRKGVKPSKRRTYAYEPLEERMLLSVAPCAAISSHSANTAGPYTLNLSGPSTITSWIIDWGDQSGPKGNGVQVIQGDPSNVTHDYASPGTHTIAAAVTDATGTHPVVDRTLAQACRPANDGGLQQNSRDGHPDGIFRCLQLQRFPDQFWLRGCSRRLFRIPMRLHHGFTFVVWCFPGEGPFSVDWQIGSGGPGGGTVYGEGTANGNLSYVTLETNSYGYEIDQVTVSGLNVNVPTGTSYLTLSERGVSFGRCGLVG